jgi:hypothetical protein
MTHTAFRPGFVSVFAAAAVLFLALPGAAAQRQPATSSGRLPALEQGQPGSVPLGVRDDADAERTREALNQLLEKYPPALGRVLKLDPSLMNNPGYLAPYPGLAAFLSQHPEIMRNPDYFLERVNSPNYNYYNDPARRKREEMLAVLAGFAAFLVFLVVTSVLVWIIRMIVNHRRWNRLSKVQYEVHNKLLDRFTSNEDLLAYVQTPAGKRFLESAPIPLQDEAPMLSAPFSRILWSVQAGVVLTIAGLGLLYVSTRFIDEPAQFFMVIGVLSVALGGGFIVSAAAAYVLSRKLGLLDPPATHHA